MQHIFFTGGKGVGKSTLINALLQGKKNIGGFRTVKHDGGVYLLRPQEEIRAENRLFFCGETADPMRFNTLGCAALTGEFSHIIMDELGPHEEQAKDFQQAVFQALDGCTPIVGALQKADSEFLHHVASHPRVNLIEVTRENRDRLYEEWIPAIVGREQCRISVLDSTNDEIKRRLAAGTATEGLTVIADAQTAGRGRRGRTFLSAPGKGLYFSVLLQPDCAPADLPMMTAWAAVAVREAVEKACGVCAAIKWPNDLLVDDKKLCGILTELVTLPARGVILGIGLNLTQTEADFGPALADTATSLAQITGTAPDTEHLLRTILRELDRVYRQFPTNAAEICRYYRKNCWTVENINVLTGEETRQATALGVADDFSLMVRYADGTEAHLYSGEVSVRKTE